MNNTDAKQSAGYFKEKATIGLSTFSGDEILKAVLKSTSHLLKAPKEKYVQRLLAASYGEFGFGLRDGVPINEFIVRELEKRSHTHNWIIVLKTMVCFHRLLCDASDSMVETICGYKGVFNRAHIKNLADSADGAGQAFLIAQYMTYLEERCVMQIALGKGRRIELPEFEEYLKTLNANSLQPVFEILLRLFEALPAVEYREAIVNNFCTMEAYQLLVCDGKRLFHHLANRVIFVLDGFEEFTLAEKERWFDLYGRYAGAFSSIKQYFDSILCSSRVFVEPVPQLKPLPESLLSRLKGEIRASKMAREEPCTLESLGIRSGEDARIDTKEEEIRSPPAPEPAVVEQPEAVKSGTPAAGTISLDDLFVSEQKQTNALPPNSGCAPWTSSSLPATAFQGGVVQYQWEAGAPADWSTGAPRGWGSGAPTTLIAETSPPQLEQHQVLVGGVPPAAEIALCTGMRPPSKQPPPPVQSKKPSDPFKELYNESHFDLK
ncbi:hypothetical protein LSCM1_04950 [Leishmania martiniquensis]|uniref:ENTH domain-containing protein n=1 Tax=Leishmania martiniquensis TaxID=1580590 RepID=A0A836G950_9TRYP|nr:hypothetical protein LSCM1_04950 [Leishmania martiniquensis]